MVCFTKEPNIPRGGSMIKEKGHSFAKKLEIPDFKVSDGLLDKCKKR